jgi:hypothetical protein
MKIRSLPYIFWTESGAQFPKTMASMLNVAPEQGPQGQRRQLGPLMSLFPPARQFAIKTVPQRGKA